ncbi:MAG: hypothetical protein VX311_16670, partial [Planctomycetota bacterium]|nr:hypothetical protein [Planctomycetota bacterium]
SPKVGMTSDQNRCIRSTGLYSTTIAIVQISEFPRNVIPKRRAGVDLSGPIDPATGIVPEFLEVSDPAGRP